MAEQNGSEKKVTSINLSIVNKENENLKKVTSINLSVVNIKWAKGKHLNLSDMVDSYLTGEREKDVGTS